MTDEKAEKKEEKAEKKEEAKKPQAEAKEEKKEEAPQPGSSEKRKKVTKMTLAEVEKELKSTQEKMGGFQSRYSLHLLLRKKELTQK